MMSPVYTGPQAPPIRSICSNCAQDPPIRSGCSPTSAQAPRSGFTLHATKYEQLAGAALENQHQAETLYWFVAAPDVIGQLPVGVGLPDEHSGVVPYDEGRRMGLQAVDDSGHVLWCERSG